MLQATVVSDAWLGALRLLEQDPISAFRSPLVLFYDTTTTTLLYCCNSIDSTYCTCTIDTQTIVLIVCKDSVVQYNNSL